VKLKCKESKGTGNKTKCSEIKGDLNYKRIKSKKKQNNAEAN
jgi:hypothetical protein